MSLFDRLREEKKRREEYERESHERQKEWKEFVGRFEKHFYTIIKKVIDEYNEVAGNKILEARCGICGSVIWHDRIIVEPITINLPLSMEGFGSFEVFFKDKKFFIKFSSDDIIEITISQFTESYVKKCVEWAATRKKKTWTGKITYKKGPRP